MSSTYCPSVVTASVARVPAVALFAPANRPVLEQTRIAWELARSSSGTAHLMNVLSLLPMGIDQGTGVSSTGSDVIGVKRSRQFMNDFTTRRGPRPSTGTG